MEIDAFLSEILQQMIFKMSVIQKLTNIKLSSDINVLIEAFGFIDDEDIFNNITSRDNAYEKGDVDALRQMFDSINGNNK